MQEDVVDYRDTYAATPSSLFIRFLARIGEIMVWSSVALIYSRLSNKLP